MAPPFPLTLAELVGLFMESVLFGVFLVSFAACIRVLLFTGTKLNTTAHRIIFAVVLFMGFIAVFDIALLFKNVVDAFIHYTGPGGPTRVFTNLANWLNCVRGFNYGLQTLLGDAILIFRCWKVYFGSWIVIAFPIVIWLGILVCVISAVVIESNLDNSTFTAAELSPWGTGFVSLSLSLNIIVTTMIAVRVWNTYSKSAPYFSRGSTNGQPALKRVMLTVIESGAAYSTALLILLGCFVSKSSANIPMSDAMVQIIPIVFNVILLRLHQGRTSDQTTVTAGHSNSTFAWAERSPDSITKASNRTKGVRTTNHDEEPIEVEMKRTKSVSGGSDV